MDITDDEDDTGDKKKSKLTVAKKNKGKVTMQALEHLAQAPRHPRYQLILRPVEPPQEGEDSGRSKTNLANLFILSQSHRNRREGSHSPAKRRSILRYR
jgi:hypothetical protein